MIRRQVLVEAARMTLPIVSSHVALCPQEGRDRAILLLQSELGAWHVDLGQPSPEGTLSGDEGRATCRATCRAALLP